MLTIFSHIKLEKNSIVKTFCLNIIIRDLVFNCLHFWLFLGNCFDEKCMNNGILRRGENLQSRNGKYQLHLRKNGNLVLSCGSRTRWTSYTVNNTVDFLYLDEYGTNLILRGKDNSTIWRAPTTRLGAKLVVEDNGKLVLYNNCNTSIWEKGNNRSCSEGLVQSI